MPRGSRRGGTIPGRRATGTGRCAVDAVRSARAAVFAAVCVTTTALGHALMSGDALPWWAVACAFVGTASGARWLTGRERGAVAVVGATVVAQTLLHLLFVLAHRLVHASDAAVAMPGMDGSPGMRHHMTRHRRPAPRSVPVPASWS